MWITRLILINIFTSSVLGEIRVVVQYSAVYGNRPTVSLTAVQSNITTKGKTCIDRKNPCGEDSHVKVNSGEKTECYSNTDSKTCGWGFTIEVTDTYDTFHTNLLLTRDYNPGLQIDLRVTCSAGDRNVTLRNETQTYQPVHLRWTAPSPVNVNKVSKFIQLKDGKIIIENNWTSKIWSGIIGCTDQFGTSTQTTDSSADSLEKLLTYIIPTVGGGLILLIVIIIIVVFKRQRKRSAGVHPKFQRCPTTAEAPAEARRPDDDFHPTYDHLRDRVAVKRYNSSYELHDVPIYSQAQNVYKYRQPPEGSTNLDDEDRNQKARVPQNSVYSSINDPNPNLNQPPDHRNQDNGANGEIHPDLKPTALSSNSKETEAVESTHGETTPYGNDLYTKVVKSKDGASSKFGITQKPEGPVHDSYTEVVKDKKGFKPEEIEMVQNGLCASKD